MLRPPRSSDFPWWSLAILALAMGGCASRVPTYSILNPRDSLQVIADRLSAVHTISARCEMTLTDSERNSVRLDGAMVAAPPDQFRLRAWKFDRAVFDLTLADHQTWLLTPADPAVRERIKALESVQSARIGEALKLLGPEYFRKASALEQQSSSDRLVVEGPFFDHQQMICEIDRRTLTPRRFHLALDNRGDQAPEEVLLQQYRLINTIAWPTRIVVRSRQGELSLQLGEIEINGTLPDAAFVPPPRAVKQP